MKFTRLSDFISLSKLPEKIIFDLLKTNQLPLKIDSEGYLCIRFDEAACQAILKTATTVTLDSIETDDFERFVQAVIENELHSLALNLSRHLEETG